jgi:hypothetical protein
MAPYTYRADDGDEIHVEGSMFKPPCFGARKRRDGKVYRRVLDSAPVYVAPNIRSRSHQLPSWYGFRDHKAADAWSRSKGRRPNEKDRNFIAARNAERAGVKHQFDKQGRPIADTKKGVNDHIRRGRNLGDRIAWD